MRTVAHFIKVFMIVTGSLLLLFVSGLFESYESVEVVEPTLAIAPLVVAALISAGVSAAKGIAGAVKKKRGEKEMDSAIEDIKYTRPEEYAEIKSMLGQRTGSLDSRREAVEGRIERSTRAGISDIGQISDSPEAALAAYRGLKESETMAIGELGEEFEVRRETLEMDEVKGLQMGADYSDKESYYNDMYKKMVKANMGASKMGAGQNMMWQGAEGVASAGMDYFGTRYLSSAMNPQAPGSTDMNPEAVVSGMSSPDRPTYSPEITPDKIGG